MAEARRLCAYMDELAEAATLVSYHHSPLRLRFVEHSVPWDPAVLDEVRPSWFPRPLRCKASMQLLFCSL